MGFRIFVAILFGLAIGAQGPICFIACQEQSAAAVETAEAAPPCHPAPEAPPGETEPAGCADDCPRCEGPDSALALNAPQLSDAQLLPLALAPAQLSIASGSSRTRSEGRPHPPRPPTRALFLLKASFLI